jgi:hypothetical protein
MVHAKRMRRVPVAVGSAILALTVTGISAAGAHPPKPCEDRDAWAQAGQEHGARSGVGCERPPVTGPGDHAAEGRDKDHDRDAAQGGGDHEGKDKAGEGDRAGGRHDRGGSDMPSPARPIEETPRLGG